MSKDKLQKIVTCGLCGKTAVLTEKQATVGKTGTTFDLLSYECTSCKESYTTTETDSISLNNYTKATRIHNRKELRKKKISRCIKHLM